MQKSRIKKLETEIKRLGKGDSSGVYFVDLKNHKTEYIVFKSGEGDKIMFQGNKQEFDEYSDQRPDAVFIIMDIADDDDSISEWIK